VSCGNIHFKLLATGSIRRTRYHHSTTHYPYTPRPTATNPETMADILPFKRPSRKKKPSEIHKGKTLCKSGFHKWEICKDKQFDSRQGKLVTLYVCKRCGTTKSKNL
jgi:hypothetical protein